MASQESNIDRLLKARAEIDEELRRHKTALTILFIDVVGSTAYFDRYGDTAGLAMLQRLAELSGSVVTGFEGKVIKTIGDSVMAEFPEPSLAVQAAVELQKRLLAVNQKLPQRDRAQLRMGVNHGTGFRRGADVYGDVVNVAARITKHTGPAQILISRPVRDALTTKQDFPCSWLGKLTFEGKTEKEDVFEVLWTDAETYTSLRQETTAALARGDLMSPGLSLDDLMPPGSPATQIPGSETTEDSLHPGPVALEERYEILGELGRGGMGIVYKARDRETGEVIGLKVLKPEVASDQVAMERFKNELRLARKVTHKNVCRIHDFGRIKETAYISMEFVDGESLRSVLNRFETFSLRKGLKIALQICAGLKEAHSQGVVHRDLKPENVMLDRTGQAKVMDFGIARSVEVPKGTTGAIIGTPAYMAPEQAEGRTADHRADIYSLGVILYEMFTGGPPFGADTPIALALKQVREKPRPPRELDPKLPVALEGIILKCLAKDKTARFQAVEDLEGALARESGEAKQESTGLARRYPRATWVALAGALLALILTVLWFVLIQRRAQEAAKPVEPPKVQTDPLETKVKDWLVRGDKYFERGEYDAAIDAYEAALSLDPRNEVARSSKDRARKAMASELDVLRRLQKAK